MNCYCGRILRVDLSRETVTTEVLAPDVARKFIGGRGLGTYLLSKEVAPSADPLGSENKLIVVTGPLTGTTTPAASRYMVVAKSPLSGTVACSNSGGSWGPELKKAGFDLIIFEGKAARPTYLLITDGQAELRDATAHWGKLVPQATDLLLAEAGDPKARVMTIGPAGERLSPIAAIMNDRFRAAGRSGVGAVMGSKNLKAVVVRGTGALREPVDPVWGKQLLSGLRSKIRESPVTGQSLPTYGTAVLVNIVNEVGAYPTRNFQESYFPTADEASGEKLRDTYLVRNTACFRCPIACGRKCVLNGQEGEGPEYETLWAFSADCGIDDLEAVIQANNYCNEYGLDTISAGATLACAMELVQRGHIPPKEVDGPPLAFGSAEAVVEWTRKMGAGEGLGAKLALGSYRLAEMYGHAELSMSVKRLEIPAYDPRGIQGQGLQYATSNRGGCHVRGYLISPEILGVPTKVDRFSLEGKAALAKAFQDLTAVIDSLGLCLFTSFAWGADEYRDLYNAYAGTDLTTDDVWRAGERIWNLERMFNLKAGIDPGQDRLPKRLLTEPVPEGGSKGEVHRLAELLPEYYRERGWDETGIPTQARLSMLELA